MKKDHLGLDVPIGGIYDEPRFVDELEYLGADDPGDIHFPGDDARIFRELWKLGIETPTGEDLRRHGLGFL